MLKRKTIYIIILFLSLIITNNGLYAQKDSSATHSLDEYKDVDSATAIADSVDYDNEDEESATDTSKYGEAKFSPRIADTLNSVRNFSPGAVDKIKADDEFWYANSGPVKEEEKKPSDFWEQLFMFFQKKIVKTIAWIIMIGILATAFIMYLINNKIGIFSSRGRKLAVENNTNEVPENIFDIDFSHHLQLALDEHNYRLATRLFFLKMLRTMSEQQILQYSIDKTNMDYLFELNGTKYFKDFAAASRNYEYVWYGNFNITQEQFALIKKNFEFNIT